MKRKALFLVTIMIASALLGAACGDSGNEKNSETAKASVYESATQKESLSEKESETEPMKLDERIEMVYVKPDYDGTPTGSNFAPYNNLSDAYTEAVRRINDGETDFVTVKLFEGEFLLDEELKVDGKTLSATDYAITFEGSGEDTVLSTTVSISGEEFEEVSENIYQYTLPDETKGEDGKFPLFRDLFLNGKRLALAGYDGESIMVTDSATNATANGYVASDRTLYVADYMAAGVPTDSEGYFIQKDGDGRIVYDDNYDAVRTPIEYYVKTEWQLHKVRAERLVGVKQGLSDPGTGAAIVGIQICAEDWKSFVGAYYNTLQNCHYTMGNSLAYLDRDGYFYYSRETGTIYLYSSKPIDEKTVSYPVAERVFHLEDVKNVTFSDLTLTGTTMNYMSDGALLCGQGSSMKNGEYKGYYVPYAGIYGKNVENITVSGCYFRDLGADAVFFCGSVDKVTVENSIFENIGSAGVRIGQAVNTYNATVHSKDITITNNCLHNIATTHSSSPAIIISSVLNLELTYNTIDTCQYSAISVGYDWTPRNA